MPAPSRLPCPTRRALALGLASAMLLGCACGAEAQASQSQERRQATVGQALVLTLQTNPSTGYDWQLDEAASAGLAHVGIESLGTSAPAAQGQRPMVGAAVSRSWRITPSAPGAVRIVLRYVRAWQPADAARVHTLHIDVTR